MVLLQGKTPLDISNAQKLTYGHLPNHSRIKNKCLNIYIYHTYYIHLAICTSPFSSEFLPSAGS